MKRGFTLLIAVLMLFCTSFTSYSDEGIVDIDKHWAKPYIKSLMDKDSISGYPDGTFKPDDTIKVGEFTKILIISLGYRDVENPKKGHWASNYMEKALEIGLITEDEVENDYEDLDRNITKAEIAKMIASRLEGSPEKLKVYKSLIADFDSIPDKYQTSVLKTYSVGIVTGTVDNEFKPDNSATRAEASTMVIRLLDEEYRKKPDLDELFGPATSHQSRNFTVNGKTIKTQIVTIDLNNPKIKLKTALAKDTIGGVDSLENIANTKGAIAAINGTYFGAYSEDKDPYGVLVIDGKKLHNGRSRSVFGFDKDNNVDIDIVGTLVRGYSGEPEWKYSWPVYWLNHTPFADGESVVLYTPDRGDEIRTDLGTNVVVKDGVITQIVDGNVPVPENGLVINLYGNIKSSVIDKFIIGNEVRYTVEMKPEQTDAEFWQNAEGAVGAGPGLVWDGKVNLRLQDELFTEAKITTTAAARSAIGFTADNKLILLTTRSATIGNLAEVMVQLGCVKAMNLDGGASSGLYYDGKNIRKTGRLISNAILVIEE